MRILSLSTCPLDPTLGSGKTRLRWSEGLRALGHTVEMVEPIEFETWHGQGRALRFRQAWGACEFVGLKLRAGDYDAIEFFGGEFGLATWKLSKLPHRPLLIAHTDGLELLASERERVYNPPVGLTGRLRALYSRHTHERLSRAAFVYADAFVTGCELDRESVLRLDLFPRQRTAVVEPGLDAEYLSTPFTARREKRVAYVGSWIPRKGVRFLSAIMSSVMTREPEVLLDIYGTGEKPAAVLTSFPAALRGRITVHPRLTNQEMADGLAKAGVFFFPTQYEGFGMALAEAMACGCAPVTTRTGFGATLRDGEEALLCDFTEAGAMERAILTLLHDEGLRAAIARRAWERVRAPSWEVNVAKLEAVYTQWTAEHRLGADGVANSNGRVRQTRHSSA
jgi:glycosyltransferase involved in cell wall biosynthesis